MKHKVCELEGMPLDAAVTLALERCEYEIKTPGLPLRFSGHWNYGGPILHHEGIGVERHKPDSMDAANPLLSDGQWMWCTELAAGPTPLVAAMRHFVISKLGEEVELP